MPMPIWPSTLPDIMEQGYSRAARFQNAATEMDDGPVGARRWSHIRARRETMQWFMSPAQLETFDAFFESDLKDGTVRFSMPTPNADGTTTMRTCHFEGARPQVTPSGSGDWIVAGQVTVYP